MATRDSSGARKPSLARAMTSRMSIARLEVRRSVLDLIGAPPPAPPARERAATRARGGARRTHPARGHPLAGKPLPALPENWKSATDAEGRTYFWNEISNATTYSYPPHLPEGWHLARLRSDPSVVYFYNEWTRKTVKCDGARRAPAARPPTTASSAGTTTPTSTVSSCRWRRPPWARRRRTRRPSCRRRIRRRRRCRRRRRWRTVSASSLPTTRGCAPRCAEIRPTTGRL